MLKKGNMALQKHLPSGSQTTNVKTLSFPIKFLEKVEAADPEMNPDVEADVDVDLREVYFLIMHFLSAGPCQRTCGQFWNELLEHDLLPRRYHAWYSRTGARSSDENDDGISFPLSYNKVAERYPHIEKNHLMKLLKQLLLSKVHLPHSLVGRNVPNAADVPTLLGSGSFSLLGYNGNKANNEVSRPPIHMRWPHMHSDQVRGLRLREIGGGFSRHHRAPTTHAACYAIAKPSTMVQKMQNIKKLRGHRNSVYCAIFDRSGRFVITGSDDRLVKIWSMETAYCLASCRGHEGDITDLAVSSNNALVASSSNDCIIRVWRLPDGQPISVLRGHTGVVTAIAFSPRPSAVYQLLSSSDDGTCRLWDARYSQFKPRIYLPRPPDSITGKNNAALSSSGQQNHQIFCCAFNASGTVFVTGSSDNLARGLKLLEKLTKASCLQVWNACKPGTDDSDQPIHEMDVLSGHENDVNYVQFSGCAVASRFSAADSAKEENFPKFRNSWFAHDNIVTCSRDGSAIIWIPRSRKSHGKAGRWTRAYHLKVPPPPIPPQPPRGGPRQRALPTPRGVNMIVWSLDNRFVLAAIMDCRICVWNAADGSLVHSLTGHTDSTYVLDVHPFNRRIAMSAGYDGKTIIWDIWEGKPIRTYETGHFRLVDGKFSPDGTSIVLSDDVGQLYILSTGQGESQKDAKYDQFFLGDYRPLIRDTHGNVVDQETQLPPYRRNMQDLLCDSSMIPYPEPYQSLYQQRRLGTLGIEWRPSSVRFAVGPDFNSEQEQILPLPDWDVLIDPLPEFADAMDWEPEVEVISDDADSEFNITDSFGGDGGHISSTSSGDLECSDEDSEAECSQGEGPRRSRRKKKNREIEITTSSGRRVKRRNLDECDGSSHKVQQHRKLKNGRKARRKKSSKASRPQRAAARNALTLFSKIKGRSSDGDDYGSEDDSSESESLLEDSNFESEESDKVVPDEQPRDLKGKAVALDESENLHGPKYFLESHENASNRKRLVLKLPLGDSSRGSSLGNAALKSDNLTDLVGSSTASAVPVEVVERAGNPGLHDRVGWPGGYNNETMRWGGVRARTSKRLRLNEAMLSNAAGSSALGTGHDEHESNAAADLNPVDGDGFDITIGEDELKEIVQNTQANVGNPVEVMDSSTRVLSGSIRCQDPNEVQDEIQVVANLDTPYSVNGNYPINCTREATQNVSMRLRISSKKIISEDPNEVETKTTPVAENEKMGEYGTHPGSLFVFKQRAGAEELEQENSYLKADQDHGGSNGVTTDGVNGDASATASILLNSQASHPPRNDRMYSAVYRRARSSKAARTSSDNDGPHMGESTSNASSQNANGDVNVNGTMVDGIHQAHSVEQDTAEEHALGSGRSMERSRRADISPLNRADKLPREEWGSGITVGLRSSRNRRINFVRDASPVDRRKSSQSPRKLSWLMLSVPDCTRYIPQQGDEVAYLRQGHQEYLSYGRSSARGPWECLKGEIRAVEFCKILDLEYSTVPGSGDSCCKLTLEFVDPSSCIFGKTFKLTLPEVTSFPDFLIERTRFEAAINRNWTVRDKCQVWWKNEGEEDGSWWEGRIMQVKAKSPEFPDSPWERYVIRYKSDPADTHSHSPWELHDADTQWEQPHLDDGTRKKLLSALSKLAHSGNKAQDLYGVQKLRQVSEKSNFLNRFPVPLSLDMIQSRLENNYYRSLEAVKHDIKVMVSNAESYFGKNAELLKKLGRLSEWFTRTLSSL